jgi:hypothetical protein
MIVAPQTCKSVQQFGNTHFGYRKSDFNGTGYKTAGEVKSSEEVPVFESPKKPSANGGNFNFEFKKKKGNESIEQAVIYSSSTVTSPSKQQQPMSRRRNSIPQR